MFKLKRPCASCPFKRGQGELFRLNRERLDEIFNATAFQCHKTVDYDCEYDDEGEEIDDPIRRQGSHPQQCVGLMTVLFRENQMNQIMQIADRLGALDPTKLDPDNEVYSSFEEVYAAHAD